MWQQHSFARQKISAQKEFGNITGAVQQWTLKFFFTGRYANTLYQKIKSGSHGELAMNSCIDFLWHR